MTSFAPNAVQNRGGGGNFLNKNSSDSFKVGRGAYIASLIITVAVIAILITGFFMPFIKISIGGITMVKLSGLDLVKMLFKGISAEQIEFYFIRKQIYAVAIGYLLLPVSALISINYIIFTMGDYNKKHTFIVFLLNSLSALISAALMTAFIMLQSKFIEAGVDDFLKTFSFTVVMGIVSVLTAIISFLMFKFYTDNQKVDYNIIVRRKIGKYKGIISFFYFFLYTIIIGVLVGLIITAIHGYFRSDSITKAIDTPLYMLALICGFAILMSVPIVVRCIKMLNPKYTYAQHIKSNKKMNFINTATMIISVIPFIIAIFKSPFMSMHRDEKDIWKVAFGLDESGNLLFKDPIFVASIVLSVCACAFALLNVAEYYTRVFINKISVSEEGLDMKISKKAYIHFIWSFIFVIAWAALTVVINLKSKWVLEVPEAAKNLFLMTLQ